MSKFRSRLPQLDNQVFATDGGLETTLIYHDGIDLPAFAAFLLLKDDKGRARLRAYYARYAEIARTHRMGFVLEAPTWRANRDWGEKLGYDARALEDVNCNAIGLMREIRDAYESPATKIVISGQIGPRGDGYVPAARMSVREATEYHAPQIRTFAGTDADMVSVFTMNYVDEALGVAHAAKAAAMPVAISFTLETDGRLPSGETLEQAIATTDDQTGGYPAYYMINCAHPAHFEQVLRAGGSWLARIRGLRANASRRSHAELDQATGLDAGDPQQLGSEYRVLRTLLPRLSVVGGCCGTDDRHVRSICEALAARTPATAQEN